MLILRRKTGESILIGEDIEITVIDVSSGIATLGIRAPDDVRVLRKEIQLTRFQNQEAARSAATGSLTRLLTACRKQWTGGAAHTVSPPEADKQPPDE